MALSGKLIGHVEISSGGKVLHDLLRHKPDDLSSICPTKVHGCDLLSGERGAVGSTIMWHYTHGMHILIMQSPFRGVRFAGMDCNGMDFGFQIQFLCLLSQKI